jgi:adenine-specific DNA glycosylase
MDRAGELPVMPVKKARGIEKRTILVIRDDDRILLRRRPARGLLAGLYEFPNEAGWLSEDQAVQKAREYGCEPLHIRALADAKHVFTHKEWHMHGYEIRIGSFPENSGGDTDRKTSLEAKAEKEKPEAKAGKENPKAETVRETPKAESHAAVPGRCFITTICDLQEKYALPSAYTAYLHALDKV